MITIVGGGLSGLATGLALRDLARERCGRPPRLRILEAADTSGGKIHTLQDGGFICESGPNGWLDREPSTKVLCVRLGLEPRLQPATDAYKKRYLYRRGKLYTVSMNPVRFFASPLLPMMAKLRLAIEPLIGRRRDESDESLASFARRRIGDGAFQILVDSMQSGIYAGDPEQMSVQSSFPRIVEIEQRYGSLIRGMISLMIERRSVMAQGGAPTGHLTSLRGGLQHLIDAMANELGDAVQTGTRIERIERRSMAPGYLLHAADGRRFVSDVLVLACPAYTAARLLGPLDAELGDLCASIDYAPLTVVCLGYARRQVTHALDGFGFLAPREQGLRLLGTLFSSSIFAGRAPDNHVLIRTMIGGARDRTITDLPDKDIASLVQGELRPLLGLAGHPTLTRVFRHERAIPQYTLGHAKRLAAIDARAARLGQLLITGNAYRGIGINDCIKNARVLAEQTLAAAS
ncbi:MAG: protoporphyrinogen oxidase [Proteobacteria bacterium]|nr:MAG: protoporphyrinogen oxidase [Pseudomonadota bacterium]PIE18724.1 MAG: protoporphyrinogen oxidase [Pseudomonadota bacterium]